MSEVIITRRSALLGTAIGAVAAAAPIVTNSVQAKAELTGVSIPPHARFKLGDFEMTTLLAIRWDVFRSNGPLALCPGS